MRPECEEYQNVREQELNATLLSAKDKNTRRHQISTCSVGKTFICPFCGLDECKKMRATLWSNDVERGGL
jgi:hypothetical protein